MPFVTAVLNVKLFLFHMMLPTWMPLDAFSVKDSHY